MRSEHEINRAIEEYADMIRRICFLHLKNEQDTEDIFQNVFPKYLLWEGSFNDQSHEKAWFIRVTMNACTDFLRSLFRRKSVPLDEIAETAAEDTDSESFELLSQVLTLPPKYRDVIYLFYYEGYTAGEIAGILQKNVNTIYTLLSRARALLKQKLGGESIE